MSAHTLRGQRHPIPPGAGSIDSCELPNMGARDQMWAFYKSSMDLDSLSHILRLSYSFYHSIDCYACCIFVFVFVFILEIGKIKYFVS